MKKLFTLLLALSLGIGAMAQTPPPLKTRSNEQYTQVDPFLAVTKGLGIPSGETNTLVGVGTRVNLFYNTTEHKLYIHDGLAWKEASPADLSAFISKSGTDTITGAKRFENHNTFVGEQNYFNDSAPDFKTFINGGRLAILNFGNNEGTEILPNRFDLSGIKENGITWGSLSLQPDAITFGHPAVVVNPVKMFYDTDFGNFTIGYGLPASLQIANNGFSNSASMFSNWDDGVSSSSIEANKTGVFVGRQDGTNDQTLLMTSAGITFRDAIDQQGAGDYGDYSANKGPYKYATKKMLTDAIAGIDLSNYVAKTGNERINGRKEFAIAPYIGDAGFNDGLFVNQTGFQKMVGGTAYVTSLPDAGGILATTDDVAGKANLSGDNSFIGNQSVTGSITQTNILGPATNTVTLANGIGVTRQVSSTLSRAQLQSSALSFYAESPVGTSRGTLIVKVPNAGDLTGELTLPTGYGTLAKLQDVVSKPYMTVTSDYTLNSGNHTVMVNTSSSAITITLPDPSTVDGQIFYIKKKGSSNQLTVDCGSYLADGSSSLTMYSDNETYCIQATGSTYQVLTYFRPIEP